MEMSSEEFEKLLEEFNTDSKDAKGILELVTGMDTKDIEALYERSGIKTLTALIISNTIESPANPQTFEFTNIHISEILTFARNMLIVGYALGTSDTIVKNLLKNK